MGFFERFASTKPSEAAIEAASDKILHVANAAMSAALRRLDEAGIPQDNYAPVKVFVDYACFFYHWIDRLAFVDLGANWQPFTTALRRSFVPKVQRAIGPDVPESERPAATKWVDDLFEVILTDYRNYTAEAALKDGTLIHEIGKSVALSIGKRGYPKAVEIGSHCAAVGLNVLDAETVVAAGK